MNIAIINKKQDTKKSKDFLSSNEKARYEAIKKYYKSLEEAIDKFLGKDGTKKIFGERRYLTMWEDFVEMFQPILPIIKVNADSIEKQIKEKYSNKNSNVLKDNE